VDLISIDALPLAGGPVTTLAVGTSGTGGVPSLTIDSTYAYYTQYVPGAVTRVPLAGGPPTTLASLPNPAAQNGSIAVDGTRVYCATEGSSSAGAVTSLPIGGGQVTTLAWGTRPNGVALDNTSIYWTDTVAGTVTKLTPK
jgi:sugar lactone lactonase YvrE